METDMDVRAVEDLRSELKGDIKDLRTELKGDIKDLQSEMLLGFTEVRRDMDVGFAEMRADMKDLQGSLIRWMVGSLLTFVTLMGFLLSATNLFG